MGYLRLLLAILICLNHLAAVQYIGAIAVFGFFVLSGFLITMIINEVYCDGIRGKSLFLLNRFLRIYPVYWVCFLLALLFLYYSPIKENSTYNALAQSDDLCWRQIFIFGLVKLNEHLYYPRILAPAWSLNIELVYYMVIGLALGQRKYLCIIWFFCAFLYWAVNRNHTFAWLYFSFLAPSLQFSAGALGYHYRHFIPKWRWGGHFSLLACAFIITILPACIPEIETNWAVCYFFCILGFAYIIPAIYRLEQESPTSFANRLCGRISYPFFLIHYSASQIVVVYWLHKSGPSSDLFLYTMIFLLMISAVIIYVVEWPMERIRLKVRLASQSRGISRQPVTDSI